MKTVKKALISASGAITAALLFGLIVKACIAVSVPRPGESSAVDPQKAPHAGISFDRETLLDKEKQKKAFESMKDSYDRLKLGDPKIYLKLPESEFVTSLVTFLMMRSLGSKEVVLTESDIASFRKNNMPLYQMDRQYPFMKPSIYLDPSRRTMAKPLIKRGTNFIIVFVESFSAFFMREDVHGIKGLTPNIANMRSKSYSFEQMYNATFPTLKGLIAHLGSTLYMLDENVGGTRLPVPCRFLFLSSIMKEMNYHTIHIQAGSERFIGMKDLFTEHLGYDEFYGAESLMLKNISTLKGGFGVSDEAVFNTLIEKIKKPDAQPFFITISTINTHPPFKVTHKNPAFLNNTLLNALYSTDKSFGEFWDYFMSSPLRDNTVVIVTADHAMGNNSDYALFAGPYPKHYRPYFDLIPFFIYFPGGAYAGQKNNTACTSIDVTPTILDMMNVDLANPFAGLSIFSERPLYPFKMVEMKEAFTQEKMTPESIAAAKRVIQFYLYVYNQDRIVPKNHKIKLKFN